MNKLQSLFLLACLWAANCAWAADGNPGMFAKGQKQFTVLGGTGDAFEESYFIIGAGANYYLIDGLNVGLQAETWTGGDPGILKIAVSTSYVFYQIPQVSPYAGVFYRYTDIKDLSGLSSVGARAGVYLPVGRNGYAGIGGVYESYLDCNTRTYASCHTTYTEISFAIGF